MGALGWDLCDGPMGLVKVIAGGVYEEDHWRLGKLRNKSGVSG